MTVVYRAAGADDLEAVMNVMGRAFDPAFGEAWNRGQCLGILALPDVALWVATDGEDATIVGFALGRLLLEDAELLLLAVDPAQRQRGIGAGLIDQAAAWSRVRGATRLLLEMRDGNAAGALYQACGFGRIGRRPNYYRGVDGAQFDALTLALPLN